MKFEDLKSGYEQLFQKCAVNADKVEAANQIVERILANEEKYRLAQNKSGVPWSVGQVLASIGFTIYSYQVGNWVFTVTNGLLLINNIIGVCLYFYFKRKK